MTNLNKDYILFPLKEAKHELDRMVDEIEKIDDYGVGEYNVDIQHLYHHINSAWNARESSKEECEECSEQNFEKWRQFPSDIYMGL